MNSRTLLVAIAVVVVIVLGAIYLIPGSGGSPEQQPSPHAINQTN